MSVILETSFGDLTIDLLTDQAPLAAQNFLKLCKVKYYNNRIFHHVESNFVAVCGADKGPISSSVNPTSGRDRREEFPSYGPTIWGLIDKHFTGIYDEKPEEKYISSFPDEIADSTKHDRIGVVATANERHHQNGGSFYITLGTNIQSLDGKHTIFGYVVEGLDDILLGKINKTPVNDSHQPLQNLRIRHTIILDDPFPDPPYLKRIIPSRSPSPVKDPKLSVLKTLDDELRVLEKISQNEARSRAIALEILGDIPDADMKPPDNVLFLCKLNPYTEEEDLETIFSQFGKILSCNIIRDWKTNDSLQYGFIEFEDVKACENAFFKMQDVLIDDRRIHVDFCQSVSRQWYQMKHHGNRATQQDALDTNAAVDAQKRSLKRSSRDHKRRVGRPY